tara:strand:- start:7024 stop:7266 length:243 start_codon:yes stop_codon:yes gene_type:complete
MSKHILQNEYFSSDDETDDKEEMSKEDIEIENEDYEYNSIISIIETINDFREKNNPLVLDKMTQYNLLNFLDSIKDRSME